MAIYQDSAFDAGVATREFHIGLAGESAEPPAGQPHPAARSAFDVATSIGTPPDVSRGFLAQLGLDESASPNLFLEFDPEDINQAKREFSVDGEPATALHRALINSWMRAVAQAVGERPLSLLDAAFRGAGPPTAAADLEEEAAAAGLAVPPRAFAGAPGGPHAAEPQLQIADRAGVMPAVSASEHGSLAMPRLMQQSPKAGEPSRRLAFAQPAFGQPPGQFVGAPPLPQHLAISGAAAAARRMGDVLDQADPGLFATMSRGEVQAAWQTHTRLTGMPPRAEAEPSPE